MFKIKDKKKRTRSLNEDEAISDLVNASLKGHNIRVSLEGNYFSLIEYLSVIDKEKIPILWQSVNYAVEEYPVAKINLVIRTLSLKRKWLRA